MDQIKALRTFARVADLGSFAAAARSMDLAPSVVTRLVAELEQHIGARLLTRTTRSVSLTQIGQRYLERVRRILHEVDEAATAVQDEQGQLRGRVRLHAPVAFAIRQLVPRLDRLRSQHPDIVLDISTAAAVETPSEASDISIVILRGKLDGDFIAHTLASSQMLLCAAPGYLQRHGRPRRPDDLAQHAMLLAGQHRRPGGDVLTHASAAGGDRAETTVALTPGRVALNSHDAEVGRASALASMGIAALPSFSVRDDLLNHRLERVLGDWRLFDMTVHACLPSRKQKPAVVQAVLNFLRAEFATTAGDPWLLDDAAPARRDLRLAA